MTEEHKKVEEKKRKKIISKRKTEKEISISLVGRERRIRDSSYAAWSLLVTAVITSPPLQRGLC